MKRAWVIVCAVFVSYSGLRLSCQANAPTTSAPTKTWSEHLRNATVSFGIIESNNGRPSFKAIGTGVIIAQTTPSSKTIFAFATARHVIDNPGENWHPAELRVRFASEERRSLEEDTGYRLALIGRQGKMWLAPSDDSDIAIIPIGSDFISQMAAPNKVVTDAIFMKDFAEDSEIFQGNQVLIFGFPGDVSVLMGANALVRAVLRSGTIAWTNPSDDAGAYMIDANILPGNSGGPVFETPLGSDRSGATTVGRPTLFMGIVTATVGNDYVQSIGGLGRVEPASKIKKLFETSATLIPIN